MIQLQHICCHSSLYLEDQPTTVQQQVGLHPAQEHPIFGVVQAELVRQVTAVIPMITFQVFKMLILWHCRVGQPLVKVDDRVKKVSSRRCLCIEVNQLGQLNNMRRAAKEWQHLSPSQHRCRNEL